MSDHGSDRLHLSGLLFEVTDRCNLGCRYCYNVYKRPGERSAKHSSDEYTARRTLTRLFEMVAVDRVTMSGGEPFLAEGFTDLVRFCRERGKGVLITSNGNGGTDEQYEEIAELGVRTVVMPFHSAKAEEHDQMSSVPGSHARSVESLELLRSLRFLTIPIIVITRINASSLEETLLELKSRGFRRIIVNRLNYGGRVLSQAGELALCNDELRSAYQLVNDMAVKCGLWVSSNVCTPHCVLDPGDYPRVGFGACDINLLGRPVTLDAQGNVRFCNHSPVVMGNIYHSTLEDILATDYAHKWRDTVPSECVGCSRWEQCVGGCRAASEQVGKDMTTVDPIAWKEGPFLRVGTPR